MCRLILEIAATRDVYYRNLTRIGRDCATRRPGKSTYYRLVQDIL